MKITAIPQSLRNVKRATEIISVLSKYGLADWLSRFNLDLFKGLLKNRSGDVLANQTREARIRLALSELGPTFIKLGQILSTRPDLCGVRLAEQLKLLQADAPADRPDVARAIIEAELGQPIDDLFEEFSDEPLASASIGQVHAARLKTGEAVVVKVQHKNIERKVHEDLDILGGLAILAERIPELVPYRPIATVAEFQRALRRELDFGREERNLIQFVTAYESDSHIRIPRPFSDLCTPRVLTMERIEGLKISEKTKLHAAGIDLDEIARRGADLYLRMIFTGGFYHADPHPGNIVLLPGNVIGLLDFGMVGRIDERLREDIEELLLAIVQGDSRRFTTLVCRIGEISSGLDESALSSDAADFVAHYATQTLGNFNLAAALNEMTELIRRYEIRLPAQVGMLLKVLVMLEGTAKSLSPSFSIMEVMKPLRREILMRRLSPKRQIRKMQHLYGELEYLAEVMPRKVLDILAQIQSGKFDVHLEHRRLGPSVNRLVLGMLASALFLGSSLMLSRQVPPVIYIPPASLEMHSVSVLGLSGCIVSLMLGVRLLLAMGKSGHLDRPE